MATMTAEQQSACRSAASKRLFALAQSLGISKPNMLAAVAATDQWISDNAASYNAALPQPFKADANAAQKAILFMVVAEHRYLGGV